MAVDSIFKISVSRGVEFVWGTSAKTVWFGMLCGENVNKGEGKQEDFDYPTIDCGIELQVGIVYHSLNVFSIDFNKEVVQLDEVYASFIHSAK